MDGLRSENNNRPPDLLLTSQEWTGKSAKKNRIETCLGWMLSKGTREGRCLYAEINTLHITDDGLLIHCKGFSETYQCLEGYFFQIWLVSKITITMNIKFRIKNLITFNYLLAIKFFLFNFIN